MAQNSLDLDIDETPFHPCLTPKGMTWYDLDSLTPLQQKLLNDLKLDIVKENNKYLAEHPEVRAIIFLLLKAILKERPIIKTIGEFAADFFNRSEVEIQMEIDAYLKERGEPKNKEGDSAVNIDLTPYVKQSSTEISTTASHENFYTYLSYTDVSTEMEHEWMDEDYKACGMKPTTSVVSEDKSYITYASEVLNPMKPMSTATLNFTFPSPSMKSLPKTMPGYDAKFTGDFADLPTNDASEATTATAMAKKQSKVLIETRSLIAHMKFAEVIEKSLTQIVVPDNDDEEEEINVVAEAKKIEKPKKKSAGTVDVVIEEKSPVPADKMKSVDEIIDRVSTQISPKIKH